MATGNDERIIEVAISQGNRFLQDLLRSHGAQIGRTKTQFRANLQKAIEAGLLSVDEIEEWLDKVEGWGAQHCYIYRVPSSTIKEFSGISLNQMQSKVAKAGFGKLWDSNRHEKWSKDLGLSTIRFIGGTLTLTWQRTFDRRLRRGEHDFHKSIEGEEIEFEAWSLNLARLVPRFAWKVETGIAAIYVPQADEFKDYPRTRDRMANEMKALIDITQWKSLDVRATIKKISEMSKSPNGGKLGVKSNETVFLSTTSTLGMKSNSQASSIHQDDLLLPILTAVEAAGLPSDNGDFRLNPSDRPETHLKLVARDNSVVFWGQMADDDIFGSISDLAKL